MKKIEFEKMGFVAPYFIYLHSSFWIQKEFGKNTELVLGRKIFKDEKLKHIMHLLTKKHFYENY